MYSFGPLPNQKRSGRHIGTHQKIDRIARRHLKELIGPSLNFPAISEIIHFEGSRGPDGIKLKSPGHDEPRHFIDPLHPAGKLLDSIHDHRENLIAALRSGDEIRAAFEAAWLAHAVADGLTPAHQEPFDDQIRSLRSESKAMQKRVRGKLVMSGSSKREILRNNWSYWGAKGVMTTHTLFEAGVAVAVKPYNFKTSVPSQHDCDDILHEGFEPLYIRLVNEVASLHMYEKFKADGWTKELAQQTKGELLPRIIMAVTLAWYDAAMHASKGEKI